MISYLGGIETIVSGTLLQMIGDPTLLGVLCLLCFVALWSFLGAGYESGIIIFVILLAILANYGFLPAWILFLIAIGLGIAVVLLFSVFRQH